MDPSYLQIPTQRSQRCLEASKEILDSKNETLEVVLILHVLLTTFSSLMIASMNQSSIDFN